MRKLFIIAASIAALAAPTAAMASAPVNPGGFGQERAGNLADIRAGVYSTDLPGASYWAHNADGAVARAGDNGTINQEWMADNGFLPVESSLNTQ
jgi:hypothetical protein